MRRTLRLLARFSPSIKLVDQQLNVDLQVVFQFFLIAPQAFSSLLVDSGHNSWNRTGLCTLRLVDDIFPQILRGEFLWQINNVVLKRRPPRLITERSGR